MDEQRPADGSPVDDDGPPEPVDDDGPPEPVDGADGPPPPPPPPAGAPPSVVPPAGAPPAVVPGAAAAPPEPPTAGAAPTSARRSRWPLVVALLVVVLGVPLALVALSGSDDDEPPVATPDGEQDGAAGPEDGADDGDDAAGDGDSTDDDPGESDDDPGEPGEDPGAPGEDPGGPGGDGGIEPDAELEPLDLDALTGIDRTYGRLLTDIDASERTMIDFQAGLAAAFGGSETPEDALDEASEVAAGSREALLGVRDRLTTTLDDPGADRVRELYVAHLDAWEGFMAAVEEDPLAAFEQGESGATVRINATADAFARALEAELPDDVDAEVARYAEGLLDRGFRDMGYADV